MYKFLILLALMFVNLQGQDTGQKEDHYLRLQSEKKTAEQDLDSLNRSLDAILNEIDYQKSRNNKDKTAQLMSSAFSITKQIEQTEISGINDSISNLEKELNNIYSKKMAEIEKKLDGDISETQKKQLEKDLGILAEKRIHVFPVFRDFNFNPQKIKEINLSEADDQFEKEIFLDYLKSALAQVDSNLTIIEQKENELEDNKRLEEKANIFMGDVANSRVLGFYDAQLPGNASESESNKNLRENGPAYGDDEWEYPVRSAISNTISFLNQLEYLGMPDDEQIKRYKTGSDISVSSDDYLDILKSSHKFLLTYRNMLKRKISGK